MYKTIGILAHVDAGKTTLSEQILYRKGVMRKRGRVDHQDTLLDSSEIEKRRGITIYSDAASFCMGEDTYYLIDTPGHMDFQAECERVLPVLDYAVLVIDGLEMVQAHTENLYHMLRRMAIPIFLFLNKCDRKGFFLQGILEDIRKKLGACIYVEGTLEEDGILPEPLLAAVAETDEGLLLDYLEERMDNGAFFQGLVKGIGENKIMPVFSGSALNDIGVEQFLHNFHLLTQTFFDSEAPFRGRVFRVCHEPDHTRVVYMKCLSGRLRVKEEILYGKGEEVIREKSNQLRLIQGPKYQIVSEIEAGMVFAATGIHRAKSGQCIGNQEGEVRYSAPPVIKAKVQYAGSKSILEVLKAFKEIEDEEPFLQVEYLPSLRQIQMAAGGVIQLELVQELCLERYGLEISFGECGVVYKETLEEAVTGYGHYEPLRHYAEVHLRLEPGARGSGIVFQSSCPLDDLSRNWQNLVKTHIFEKKHPGVLTGSQLTDVSITLLAGREHQKHTEGGDFREAVYRAVRQGLRSGTCSLLEPFYLFDMEAEAGLMNRLLSDITKRKGSYHNPGIEMGMCKISGRGPAATFLDYYEEFLALTKGRGRLHLTYGGYDQCHNQQEAIDRIGYEPDRDLENPSGSIFCSHGAGYEVKWEDAKERMHIK